MLVSRWNNRDLPSLNDKEGILKFWYCNFCANTKNESEYTNFKTTEPKQIQTLLDKVQKGLDVLNGIV